MRFRAAVALLWSLACILTGRAGAKPKKKDDELQKVLLPHHSFISPLEYHSLLDDWTVSGASLFERERLLLHPGVPERFGFLWSNSPLLTNNFEVIFHFRVVGEKQPERLLHDQSFGFFYTSENISNSYNETAIIKAGSWTQGMTDQGFTLSGSKANFEGIGVVLSVADKQSKPRPAVSGFTNDGHTKLSWEHDVPTPDAKPIEFRNTLNAAQMRIRVKPTSVEGWLKQSPSLSWNECFVLDRSKHPIKAGGYIGLTAWSGTQMEGVTSDLVSIVQLDVSNMDETSIGEEMKDVSAQIQETYRQMLTDENRHFLDQKSQTEHLARLVDMVGEHIKNTKPAEEKIFQDIKGLEQRIERLGEDCKNLVQGTHMFMGTNRKDQDNVHKASVQAMKDQIIGLRRLLAKDGVTHQQALDAVQKNLAEVKVKTSSVNMPEALKLIVKQTESLERTVKSRGSQMSGMMLCLMAAIIAIGVLMWNRMRYYEKKHFI